MNGRATDLWLSISKESHQLRHLILHNGKGAKKKKQETRAKSDFTNLCFPFYTAIALSARLELPTTWH